MGPVCPATGGLRSGREFMKDPVVPLKLALYGHPDSGGIWERHCETELKKVGFEAVLTDIWKSVFYHPTRKLLLVVYVDDFKLAQGRTLFSTCIRARIQERNTS